MSRGRTVEQVARAMHRSPRFAREVLRDFERQRLVERDGDLWRLTARAERELGLPLRTLLIGEEKT
jgi:hypothetical protein